MKDRSEPCTIYQVGRGDRGKRLDRFLGGRIPALSRNRVQQAIRERVTLSWSATARPSTRVRFGGEVRVGYTPLHEDPVSLAIAVLDRGPGWLAVDKPAGVPVHPVNRVRENSLIRILRRQLGRAELRLAHRLDRETSGVLLIAEDPAAARVLSGAFERADVHKQYLAVVRGEMPEDEGEITLPIGPAPSSRVWIRLAVREDGRPARTAWRVERRWAGRTLLRVSPRTGRRHQIRIHLAAIGHPVLGDILYGRPDDDYLDWLCGVRDPRAADGSPSRHMLHCARLEFPTPSGDRRVVTAAAPRDFLRELEAGGERDRHESVEMAVIPGARRVEGPEGLP